MTIEDILSDIDFLAILSASEQCSFHIDGRIMKSTDGSNEFIVEDTFTRRFYLIKKNLGLGKGWSNAYITLFDAYAPLIL